MDARRRRHRHTTTASQHRCSKCIANLARPALSPANHARCVANDAALPARIELPQSKSGQPLAFFAHRRSSTIIGAWISTDHLATSLPPTYPRNNSHHRPKQQLRMHTTLSFPAQSPAIRTHCVSAEPTLSRSPQILPRCVCRPRKLSMEPQRSKRPRVECQSVQ